MEGHNWEWWRHYVYKEWKFLTTSFGPACDLSHMTVLETRLYSKPERATNYLFGFFKAF